MAGNFYNELRHFFTTRWLPTTGVEFTFSSFCNKIRMRWRLKTRRFNGIKLAHVIIKDLTWSLPGKDLVFHSCYEFDGDSHRVFDFPGFNTPSMTGFFSHVQNGIAF